MKRYEVLVHSPPTSPPQGPSRTSQPQERPSSGVSGWGLLGIAAGAIAVGAAAAVVSSLHDDSNSSSESDSDTTDQRAADKEDADLAEAIRQSLLPQPASPPPAPAPDPSQDSTSANAGRGPGSSAPPRGFSNSSSALPAPECIVCWDGLNRPKRIHQCVNGHFVCDDCRLTYI